MPTLKNESDQAHHLNYATTWAPVVEADGTVLQDGVTPAEFYKVSGGAALHLLPGDSVKIPQALADALTNAATSAGLTVK